jgi:hypothetical protein
MKTISTIWSAVAAVTVVALAVFAPTTLAQTGRVGGGASEASGDNSLRVSPVKNEISAKPGESKKTTIYIQNVSTVALTLKPVSNDFVADSNEDGSPSIIFDDNEYAPTHSLKRFMQPVPNITVGPGERKAVEVTINIPHNAQAGGYYGAVRFAPVLPDGTTSVSIEGSVASLILLRVEGNIVENLTLKQFAVLQKGKEVSRLSSSKDVDVLVRLENKGNVHVAPFGEVFVQKGDTIVHKAKFNDVKPAGTILPDSTRKWTVPADKLGSFGKYKITAVIGYGSSNKTINVEKTIWVIPSIILFAIIAGLIILVAIIVAIVMSLRAYKRRILRSTRRR